MAKIRKPLTEKQKKRKNELRKIRRWANIEEERIKAKALAKIHRIRNPEWALFSNMRCRAKEKRIEFNIKASDVVIPEYCPVLGIKLNRVGDDGYTRKYAPSCDRIDNSKGYTKDNIRIISERANRLKSDATIKEVEAILKYMKENTS